MTSPAGLVAWASAQSPLEQRPPTAEDRAMQAALLRAIFAKYARHAQRTNQEQAAAGETQAASC